MRWWPCPRWDRGTTVTEIGIGAETIDAAFYARNAEGGYTCVSTCSPDPEHPGLWHLDQPYVAAGPEPCLVAYELFDGEP